MPSRKKEKVTSGAGKHPLLWITVFLCVVPFVITLIIPSSPPQDAATSLEVVPSLVPTSDPVHSMFEIAAFLMAMLVVVMAFFHYSARGDFAAPVIGLALFSGGFMDFLHIMAAEGFLGGVADPVRFVPFSWMLARAVPAVILILCSSMFMITDAVKSKRELKKDTVLFGGLVLLCALVSGAVLFVAMTKKTLPQCIFPEALLKRPLELIPTALLLMAGIYCLPMFFRWHKTSYSFALWLSVIPLLVAEMHMLFGGDELYNLHVYAAHALKGFAYTLALIGLELDYRKTYLKAQRTSEELREDLLLLDQEEESLSRLQHMLDAVLAHVCEGVYLKDVSGCLLRVNDVYADMYETEEVNHMVTQTEADFRPDAAAARNHEEDLKAMTEGQVVRDEPCEMSRADGRVIRVLRSRIPLWDKEGNVVGLLGLCRQTED